MSARRFRSTVLVSLCALVGSLALAGQASQAAITHKFLSRITEVPAEGPHKEAVPSHGPLEGVQAMTVTSGGLWIAERGGLQTGNRVEVERVDEFDAASGKFEAQLPQFPELYYSTEHIAVGNATPGLPETELYLGAVNEKFEGVVAVSKPSGGLQATWTGADTPYKSFSCRTSSGESCSFPFISDIAVDNSDSIADWAAGYVYVATSSPTEPSYNVVDVFKPEAGGGEKYVGQLPGPEAEGFFPLGGRRTVVVDESNGDVLVGDSTATGGIVYVYEPTAVVGQYALVRSLTGTPGGVFKEIGAVAVDSGNGDIYVSERAAGIVYELDSEGKYLGRLTGTPSGEFGAGNVKSVAVDPATHDVYVSVQQNTTEAVDIFGPNATIPDVTSEPASNLSPTSATLNGTVNPDETGEATCRFVWGTSESFGEEESCEEPVAQGGAPVPVHAKLGTLQPDTTYYYRLQATNVANGLTNLGDASQTQHFTTPGPGIEQETASDVASSSATLNARIDPHGAPSTYRFQYGTSSGYGSDVPAPPGEAIGSGEGEVEIKPRHLQGLLAGTVYHYRVVVLSELEAGKVEAFFGPDETFTTQTAGAFALPDGRQWELVSPPDKHGALIFPIDGLPFNGGVVQAAADGSAIGYAAATPTEAAPAGFSNVAQVLSARGRAGWESRDISSPYAVATSASIGFGPEYRFFSEDLSLAIVHPIGPFVPASSPQALAPQEASEQTPFQRTDYLNGNVSDLCTSSCYRPLVTGCPPPAEECPAGVAEHADVPPGTKFGEAPGEGGCPPFPLCGPTFVGASPDARSVLLTSYASLTPTPAPAGGLYEWSAGKPPSERLQLVSVMPGGEASPGDLGTINSTDARHAVSDDGSRVFWSAHGDLYMRDLTKGKTVQLDALQGGRRGSRAAAVFQIASNDGSRAFFTDGQQLTGDSGAPDLYECEMVEEAGEAKCGLSDLTPLGSSGEQASVQGGVLGASEDGSYVYFVADGVLENGGVPVPGAVHGTCNGGYLPGAVCNLYVRHEGTTRLVAVLSGEDDTDWSSSLPGLTTRVSPDGRWLSFMSNRNLTGYDTHDALSGRSDQEVYLYDAQANRLACASCNPSGARPVGLEVAPEGANLTLLKGETGFDGSSWLAALVPGWTGYRLSIALYQSRYLSDSGRLFFDSHDALVPQDVNGTWDVYEYEPPGVGSCNVSSAVFSERLGGCVSLVTSGSSGEESAFLDASAAGGRDAEGNEGGGDVFFLTAAKLASQDYDGAFDVYDAHECATQSPCFPAPAVQPPPCGTGDACKPAPSPQPAIFSSPASATFSGAGNRSLAAPVATVKPKTLTRRQKLARALRACQKRPKKKRAACKKRATRTYGSVSGAKNSHKGGK